MLCRYAVGSVAAAALLVNSCRIPCWQHKACVAAVEAASLLSMQDRGVFDLISEELARSLPRRCSDIVRRDCFATSRPTAFLPEGGSHRVTDMVTPQHAARGKLTISRLSLKFSKTCSVKCETLTCVQIFGSLAAP